MLLFSASRDTLLKVWDANTGALVKDLKGHAHWINTLTSNTHRVIKSGPFSPSNFEKNRIKFASIRDMVEESQKIYKKFIKEVCIGDFHTFTICSLDKNVYFLVRMTIRCSFGTHIHLPGSQCIA